MPCPHCGEFQALAFSNVRWPASDGDPKKHAAILEQSDAVYYECAHCHQPISEEQKPAMIRAGEWVADGSTAGQPLNLPRGSRVGVHLWAGYCLWIPWRRIAAEFIRSKDDAIALMAFTNGWLGEPFHQKIVHAKAHAFEEKCEGAAPPRVVPAWAQVLIATADTQKDHFYYVIRAWGPGYRSQRIDHGLVQTFDELRQVTLTNKYPCADSRPAMGVKVLGVDSGGGISMGGSRTHEVYRFALSDPARIKALKGESRPSDAPIRTHKVTYTPPGKKNGPLTVFLTLMDSGHYKDRLAHAITNLLTGNDAKTGAAFEHPQWALNSVNDPDYNRQMSAEHKVLLRKPGGRQFECWQPISSGAANHYFDCEYQQFAMADMLRLELMPATMSAPNQQTPARPVRSNRSHLLNRRPIRRHYDQYGGREPGLRWRYD